MAANVQAPTFDQVALKPPGAAGQVPVNRDRVIAGIRFGWALEELVWRLSQVSTPGSPAAGGGQPSSDYPPDLNHERSAAEHVRELRGLLAADGKTLLGTVPMPQSAADVSTDVDALLKAYAAGQDVSSFVQATSATRVARRMRLLDADVVDAIVGEPPEIVTAYELGKALSRTSSQISAAPPPTDVADPVQDAWFVSLNKDRIEMIRRHLTTLASALDAETVIAISASLSFWRRSYYNGLFLTTAAAASSTTGRPLFPGKDQTDRRAALYAALDAQLDIYFDLLTDRRKVSSYPVTALASNLMHQYTQKQWATWQPFFIQGGVVVVALALAAVLGYLLLGPNGTAGLTGGLTTLVGLFVARGAGLLDRGRETVQSVETRTTTPAAPVEQTGLSGVTFESLGYTLLSQVMAQIRLEENKLAISEPLVTLVMSGELNKGPEDVARVFLQRVMENDEDTNLDRLQNVLKGLYSTYKPVLPAAL